MYRVKETALYWTGTGNQAGSIPIGTILDLDGEPRTIKDRTMYKIILPITYQGKYIELKYLESYVPGESPTMPPPDEAEFRWKNSAGETVLTQTWTPKSQS